MTDSKLERRGPTVYSGGAVVYEYKGEKVHFHPKYFDPFYAPILEKTRPLLFVSDYYEGHLRYVKKGNLKMRSEGGMGVRSTSFNDFCNNQPWYDLLYEIDGKEIEPELARVSNGETDESKRLIKFPLLAESKSYTQRKLIAIPENKNPFLDYFIGSVEGTYKLSKFYDTPEGYTIVAGDIYGFAILRSAPDSCFYLSFERASNGNLIGQFTRSRLIPHAEEAREGESEACFLDGGELVPVYVSYYDPDGSGKQISKAQFEEYLAIKSIMVQQSTSLPDVLTSLLGF